MRRLSILLAAAIVCVSAVAVRADSMGGGSMGMADKPIIVTPSTIKWAPGTGDFKGLTVATLRGDPSQPGPWTIRIKLPAGTKFPVHYHADTEVLTVMSGTFWAAIGDKFDASKLMALPAGSYVVIPAGVKHYAAVKVDTVVQLSGSKPFAMMMAKGSM